MTAGYRSWEPELRMDQLTYRQYSDTVDVKCSIAVSFGGGLHLMCDEKLQAFGIIDRLQDAGGTVFMEDTWYQIQRVVPVIDPEGYITGYRHDLAMLAAEIFGGPIDPPAYYPDLDQQP